MRKALVLEESRRNHRKESRQHKRQEAARIRLGPNFVEAGGRAPNKRPTPPKPLALPTAPLPAASNPQPTNRPLPREVNPPLNAMGQSVPIPLPPSVRLWTGPARAAEAETNEPPQVMGSKGQPPLPKPGPVPLPPAVRVRPHPNTKGRAGRGRLAPVRQRLGPRIQALSGLPVTAPLDPRPRNTKDNGVLLLKTVRWAEESNRVRGSDPHALNATAPGTSITETPVFPVPDRSNPDPLGLEMNTDSEDEERPWKRRTRSVVVVPPPPLPASVTPPPQRQEEMDTMSWAERPKHASEYKDVFRRTLHLGARKKLGKAGAKILANKESERLQAVRSGAKPAEPTSLAIIQILEKDYNERKAEQTAKHGKGTDKTKQTAIRRKAAKARKAAPIPPPKPAPARVGGPPPADYDSSDSDQEFLERLRKV